MKRKTINLVLLFLLGLALVSMAYSQPSGSTILYNTSETKTPAPADYLNTSGGSFTTMILRAETQNLRWKAYVGNVTGVLTLDDSGNYSIFQWGLTSMTGEVYASRNNSITWSSIGCASQAMVDTEQTAMNHSLTGQDNINSTFSYKIHRGFFAGSAEIAQSTCKSAFTWANDTAQVASINAPFQEMLLSDGASLIYATFIDDNTQGFNYNKYDFQMIVAEKGVGGYPNTRYYFYMELQ
jgi:hypothetical protein